MEIKVAERDKTKTVYEKNIRLLSPWNREIMERVDESELWNKVKVSYNEKGLPVCSYCEGASCFRITSEHPVEEAERWAEGIAIRGKGGIFLFGSGFAYPIFEIFKKKQPHTRVVLFEQNIYLFKAMLYYFDLEPILATGKLTLLIGDIEDFKGDFDQLFFSIAFASCSDPSYAFTNAANRNFKHAYRNIHQYIFTQLALYVFYIGNDHLDNLVGFCNLTANAGEIVRNPYLSCLKDKYRAVPAFIIANGPSLDKNIHELERIKGKGLIISTESAIIPLLKNKIKPDILTIIERTKYTYLYHFQNVDYPRDMALLSLGLVDKQVYPSFPGQRIPIFRNLEAINQWVNKYLGDGSAIDAGANVSHLAFELAVYLGADPIVFVGQDYAYGPEGVTHSKDAVYLEEKGKMAREILQSMDVMFVESNEGTMIPSNQIWKDFKLGLEQKIASHPEKIILNATEGGAKISGTKCEPLSEVIDRYCTSSVGIPVHAAIEREKEKISIQERITALKQFEKSAEDYIDLFRRLSQVTVDGKLCCMEMIRICVEKETEANQSVLQDAYLINIETYQKFITDDLCRCFCQQIIFAFYYLMNRVGIIDTPEKTQEIFRIQYDFFHSLSLICESVSVHLENAAELVEDILDSLETQDQREVEQ